MLLQALRDCAYNVVMNNNTNTITFKNKTYTPSRTYRNLTLWWTNSAGTNPVWGYDFKMIATNAEGEVLFVGQNFEHITSKIDNGESGYGMSDAEAVMHYLNTHR